MIRLMIFTSNRTFSMPDYRINFCVDDKRGNFIVETKCKYHIHTQKLRWHNLLLLFKVLIAKLSPLNSIRPMNEHRAFHLRSSSLIKKIANT